MIEPPCSQLIDKKQASNCELDSKTVTVSPSLMFHSLSFTFPGTPYRIFLLCLPWLPCHSYLVVIEQQQ